MERLALDFRQSRPGGHFLAFDAPAAGAVGRIAFSVKVPFRHRIIFRVWDATGQVFQRELSPVTGVWWRYDESLHGPWDLVYGGAGDRILHQPVKSFDIYACDPKLPGVQTSEVLVKDVVFEPCADPREPRLAVSATYGAAVTSSFVRVEVCAETTDFAGGTLALRWTDWSGATVRTEAAECPPVPAGGSWSVVWPFAAVPRGRRAVFSRVALKGAGRPVRADGPAWAERPPPVRSAGVRNPDSPFGTGIYCHRWGLGPWAIENQIRPLIVSARNAGIKWLREQIVWDSIERDGKVDFGSYDAVVDICEQNGMSLCVLFGGPGRGVSVTDKDFCEKYCDALRLAVRHYRGRVAAWELRNEPNLPWPMNPAWEANYRRLLTMATEVVHAEDPSARTVGCSSSGLGVGWIRSLRGERHDDISVHPYRRYMDEPEFLEDMRMVSEAGGDRAVWLTEIGWTGWYRPFGDANLSMEERCLGFREHAALTARAYMTAAASKVVKVVCGYDYVDDGFQACGQERHMGVVHGGWKEGFVPKPAYLALATLCDHFAEGTPTMECGEDGLVVFRMGENEAVWARTREPQFCRVSGDGELSNLMGERLEVELEPDGSRRVLVSCEQIVFIRRKSR